MLQARRPALCYYRLEELRRKRKEHSHERKTILGPCCSLVWYYSPHWTAEAHPGTAKAVLASSKHAVGCLPTASFTQQPVFEGRNFKAAALYLTQRKKYGPPIPTAPISCPLDRKTSVVYYNNYGYICG